MRVYVLLDFFMEQQTTLPVVSQLSTGITVCLAVLLSVGLGTRSPPAYICVTNSRQPDARYGHLTCSLLQTLQIPSAIYSFHTQPFKPGHHAYSLRLMEPHRVVKVRNCPKHYFLWTYRWEHGSQRKGVLHNTSYFIPSITQYPLNSVEIRILVQNIWTYN
jgi:hypothetical protein